VGFARRLAWSHTARGGRFHVAAYANRPDALTLFEALRPELYRADSRTWAGAALAFHDVICGLALLGQVEEAAAFYPDAADSLTRGIVGRAFTMWATSAGIAAACAGKWDAAEEHFETAAKQAEEVPHIMGAFDNRRWYAWALLRHDAPGDRDRARGLLEEALAGYQKLEAPLFEKIATELLASC
jgi:tetratricopeptide (TPR) repeat protein